VNNASAVTGVPFDRPRVRFAHAAPDDVRRHAMLLGLAAEFDAARNEVWVRASDLERRVAPEGQEAVCAYFHRDLDARLRALPRESIAGTIRDTLLRAPTLDATMAGLARQLHMSARTLQRRLKEEGTSLRALLEQVRRARAGPLLESGQSIAEVAYLLGYAEPSAFHHAFRRWTSETPEVFRARVRKG
jgi:AraC-like DNA-binding protein